MMVVSLVLLLLFMMINPAILEPNYTETNIDTPITSFCGRNSPIILQNFISNRNSTFAQIRKQLLSNNVYYARAKSLDEGDSVFGAAQCRNYLSTAQFVACFDVGVFELVNCTTGNSAYVFLDNCFVRYDNYDNFYNNPDFIEDAGITPLQICGNQSATQPTTTFSQTAILDDSNTVAIKKIEVAHAKAKKEFENEVRLVCNVRHRNLLRLLGWSGEGSHLLLVLEYMPNGSLDKFL
ncbi:Gnk2-homologous domain-containing protein [Cynara cardunculus var. scolymus]|uniref:Gnk2-homologous domain-containing protein n=1 Tax=Cynara cardunculus var. scolymus TaxID=59895 RepID=A0A103XQD8_CYNCS|nr:Gnk2-homologous domain-containing protein [Cynara cardunculus var. scolymus]